MLYSRVISHALLTIKALIPYHAKQANWQCTARTVDLVSAQAALHSKPFVASDDKVFTGRRESVEGPGQLIVDVTFHCRPCPSYT